MNLEMVLFVKVWNSSREKKLMIMLKENENVEEKVKVKFGISDNDNMKLVTEDDGTEVEMDLEMLEAFSMGTFMILVNEEQWVPRGFNEAAPSTPSSFESTTPSGSRSGTPSGTPSGTSSGTPSGTLPQTPTSSGTFQISTRTTLTQSEKDNPFLNVDSLKLYLSNNPLVKSFNVSGPLSMEARRSATRVVANKMFQVYGDYPEPAHKLLVSTLLGTIFGFSAKIFYDSKMADGFLVRAMENARRTWEPDRKKFTFANKRKLENDFPQSQPHQPTASCGVASASKRPSLTSSSEQPSTSTTSDASNDSSPLEQGCPRGILDCELCEGSSNMDQIAKFKSLANNRNDEIQACLRKTFCIRQRWFETEVPTITEILSRYPKFQSKPELIDMEFEWQNTSCEGNFITDFPPKVEILFKQAEISKENYMQDAAAAARSSNEAWREYHAVRIACLMIRAMAGRIKRRISGLESFNKMILVVEPGESLLDITAQHQSPYPILVIQGVVGQEVESVKIVAENNMIDAGASILEGLDRLFKFFWIFHVKYTPENSNFFKLLQNSFYKLQVTQSVTSTVGQLQEILSKNE